MGPVPDPSPQAHSLSSMASGPDQEFPQPGLLPGESLHSKHRKAGTTRELSSSRKSLPPAPCYSLPYIIFHVRAHKCCCVLSRVFSNTTVQKHQFFSTQLSSQSNSHIVSLAFCRGPYLLQHHSSKASILRHSTFFIVQLSHPYITIGKTIALRNHGCHGPGLPRCRSIPR